MVLTQVVINSIIRGGELGLLAIGVTILFSLLRFANFAHGEFAIIGAYLAYFLSVTLGLNLWIAVIIAVLITGLIAVGCNKVLFKRIRNSPGVVLLVASMGLSLFLRHIVSLIWGVKSYTYSDKIDTTYQFLGAILTSTQLLIFALSVLAMIGFYFFLHHTRLGKAMRAMSDNVDLSMCRGINIEKTIAWIWFIVGCYAGLGGALIAMESVIWPELGFQIILPVFAAAVVGGIGNVYGAMIGALIIGFVENFSIAIDWSFITSWFGTEGAVYLPTGYKFGAAFLVMILVLIFFPQGVMKGGRGD